MKNSIEKSVAEIIKALSPGPFKTLEKIRPSGALQVRKQISGAISFYWRYSMGTKSERVSIGVYDPSAKPKSLEPTLRGYSIDAAVRAAENLALQHHTHDGGRPALVAQQQEAKRTERVKVENAKAFTLNRLLTDYCNHLETLGRRSHKDARSIFKLHVDDAWPAIAARPAAGVTSEEVADMMRRLNESGKGRTANKLRSYVRAAYQTAKAARLKSTIPVHFKSYRIASNPAADTEPDESANKPDKNPLSADDLRTYWILIKDIPGVKAAVLRIHLLTGGQRIEQLVNLRTADITADSITLYDGKGRPGKPPRPHTIPLTTQAAMALKELEPVGTYAISTAYGVDEVTREQIKTGDTHLGATTLSEWAQQAVGDLIPGFQAKRIRSGVETLLAKAGISTEIRGRLQSHGVSGVQARHYDGHDYLDEKRRALVTLFKLLDHSGTGNVVPIKARKSA